MFFGGIVGIGGIILLGQRMQYRQMGGSELGDEVKRLSEAVDSLRQDVGALHDDVAGLGERVEFAERLLEAPGERDGAKGD